MPARTKQIRDRSPQPAVALAFGDLLMAPPHAERSYLEKAAWLSNQAAPTPGRIVYLHTRTLATRLSGLAPVIFTAVDARTHLQVAQAYFAMTSAAALSFAEYAARCFPFPIVEFKTRKMAPFHNPDNERPHRDFRAMIGERGYLHSFAEAHSGDPFFSITSNMVFGDLSAGLAFPASTGELQRDLTRYVFYHNNSRHIPWPAGRTPLQTLRTFTGFEGTHSFSPRDEWKGGHEQAAWVFPEVIDLRALPVKDLHSGPIEHVMNGEQHEADSCH